MHLNLIFHLLLWIFPAQDYKETDYFIEFYKVDNKVDIIVNDSLVYTTGTIDLNPDLKGNMNFYIGAYLTDKKDEVIVRLNNGYEPYDMEQSDKHWEIEYAIKKNGVEYDYMWDADDDYRVGVVFEKKYYL